MNQVEQIHYVLVILMIGGLLLPKLTMLVSCLSVLGRLIYIIGYITKGANGRMAGAAFNALSTYAIGIVSLFVLGTAVFKRSG